MHTSIIRRLRLVNAQPAVTHPLDGPARLRLPWPRFRAPSHAEVNAMIWEAPAFVEVNMSAEINSYQDDFDREQDDRF